MQPRIIPPPPTMHACAHCPGRCALNYFFCFRCAAQLPEALRTQITRGYSSRRSSGRYTRRSIEEAKAYLAAPDKPAYTWQEARKGAGWAIQTLQASGDIAPNGLVPDEEYQSYLTTPGCDARR